MLESILQIRKFTYALSNNDQRQLIQKVLDTWEKQVTPNLHLLNKGVDCDELF